MSLTLHISPYDFEVKYTPQDKLSDLVKTVITEIHKKDQKTGSYLMLLVNNSRLLVIVNMGSPKDVSMDNSVTYNYRDRELTDIQYRNASRGILFDPESAPFLRKVLELHKETLYNHQLYLDTGVEKYSRARDLYRRKLKVYLSALGSTSKVKGSLNTDTRPEADTDNLSKKKLKKKEKKLKKKIKKKIKSENKSEKALHKKEKATFKKERDAQIKKTPHGEKKPKKGSLESVQLKIHSKDPFGAVSLINDKQYIEKT